MLKQIFSLPKNNHLSQKQQCHPFSKMALLVSAGKFLCYFIHFILTGNGAGVGYAQFIGSVKEFVHALGLFEAGGHAKGGA